jgi:hypothetical protein
MMTAKYIRETWRVAMRIGPTLLVIGIVLTAAAVLHGHDWWFFAVETVVKFSLGCPNDQIPSVIVVAGQYFPLISDKRGPK